ncbi:pyridine nucleotide-disulfide oxidoreductase [Suicoccus acidiformans]|uniref:Pyridine nucleotide-disulfide oxidoreductase n=1 Tax=Suicoccus acidiformans TaxID=2036206 RepID=A0A347WK77_9LACT|nr:FAD-dependent oxidoreductase [Suicoccus acidiformans]AXY25484.1 pyridine nucleotide-disulfide oxidoreductase [Suicoccus acidiformans]
MTNKQIVIVGANAAGVSAALKLRRLDDFAEIILLEQAEVISTANDALTDTLREDIPFASMQQYQPIQLNRLYGVDVRVGHRVLRINRSEQRVQVEKIKSGEIFEIAYDRLILATGVKVDVSCLPQGSHLPHVFYWDHIHAVEDWRAFKQQNKVNRVAILGSGKEAIELAFYMNNLGTKVILLTREAQLLPEFSKDFLSILGKELYDARIEVKLNAQVKEITDQALLLESGEVISQEAVFIIPELVPNAELAEASGLAITAAGAIRVDEHYQTSDAYIYAAGAIAEELDALTMEPVLRMSPGFAQKQGRKVAAAILGQDVQPLNSWPVTLVQVNEAKLGQVGYEAKTLDQTDYRYDSIYIIPHDRAWFMPTAQPLHINLYFEKGTGRLFGGQLFGRGQIERRLDVLATLIQQGATVNDLADMEFSFNAQTTAPKDPLNTAGLVALNRLEEAYRQVPVHDVRSLFEAGANFIDVREVEEYELGHIKGAVNIPMSQYRERMDELAKTETYYIYCRSGHRSYNVVKALQQRGFRVYNVAGSFLGICIYEYVTDQMTGREPIVTAYNFT